MADSTTNQDGASSPQEVQNLATIVTEWRRIQDEILQHRQAASEKAKRVKVLEAIIMNIMKQQNLGALDLKSSGGRILQEKKANKAGINKKNLARLLQEHLKDDQQAAAAFKQIQEHRGEKTKEKLAYEKT